MTSIRGPKIQAGEFIYILELAGNPHTEKGRGGHEETTENCLVLEALAEALGRMKRPVHLTIYTSCGHVLHSLQNHWPIQWKNNGWKNAKGKPVSNAGLWKQVIEELEPHVYLVTEEKHTFSVWMRTELRTKQKGIEHAYKREIKARDDNNASGH